MSEAENHSGSSPVAASRGVSGRAVLFVVALLFLGWLVSGLYTVRGEDGEVGVALRFGQVAADRVPGGVHWNPAWPVGRVVKVKTTEPFTMSVGFRMDADLDGRDPLPSEVQWLTGDTNIVNVQAIFQYLIVDPVAYTYGSSARWGFVLRRTAETAFTEVIGSTGVEDLLTDGKRHVLARVVDRTNVLLERYQAGIIVADANFRAVEPATRVQYAFREVQNAAADRSRMENEAQGYANDVIPRARGEAHTTLVTARSEADARVERARGEADRFRQILAEYRRAPELTRDRLYLETLEKVLSQAELVIVDEDTDLTLWE